MKIVGTTKVGGSYCDFDAFVAVITIDELRKVADKAGYAYRDDDSFKKVKIGDDYPIGEGHDFREQVLAAMRDMKSAHEKFMKASETMARFVSLYQQVQE